MGKKRMPFQTLKFGDNLIPKYWNLVKIVDEKGQPTDYIGVRGEFEDPDTENLFKFLVSQGKRVIGISSYQNFPQLNCNPFQNPGYPQTRADQFLTKYGDHVVLWCHCFRDTLAYFPASIPALLYSESDQYPHGPVLYGINEAKRFDCFVTIQDGAWNGWVRGLDILVRWVNFMADTLNLKVLVCGNNRKKNFSPRVTVIDFQPWHLFLKAMSSAKFFLCASGYDASPRVILEAIGLNLPVLVNENILGGWKYINGYTGTFFNPVESIKKKIETFLTDINEGRYAPRRWMQENFNVEQNKAELALTINCLTGLKYEDYIDAVLFINLAERKDRLADLGTEFARMGIPDALIHRIEGIYDPDCGHLGCTQSHLKALAYARGKGYSRVLILEDDFVFNLPRERLLFMLNEFYTERGGAWDVFMFTTYWKTFYTETETAFIRRVRTASTCAGYLVNGSAYQEILRANFQESHDLLKAEVNSHRVANPGKKLYETYYALDQHWRSLQARDKFYISEPYFGRQSGSPSTIMK